MVELNPRPNKPNLFVQVSVAVISGAAVMQVVQNMRPAPGAEPPARVAAAAKADAPIPLPVEPPPARPDPSIDAARFPPPAPAPSSMMIVPEPGGRTGGIVQIGDDMQVAEPLPEAKKAAAPEPEAAPNEEKKVPEVHLRDSGLRSSIAGVTVGHGFNEPRLHARAYARKKEAPPPKKAVAPAPRKTISVVRELGTPIPTKDLYVPSLLNPDDVPEHPFWDDERKHRVAVAGLVAAAGIIYLLMSMGFFNPLFGTRRVEEDMPRR